MSGTLKERSCFRSALTCLIRALGVPGHPLEVLFELRVVVDLEVIGRVDVPVELVVVDVVLAEIRDVRRLRESGAHVADDERGGEQERGGNMGQGHAHAHNSTSEWAEEPIGTSAILPVTATCLQTSDLFYFTAGRLLLLRAGAPPPTPVPSRLRRSVLLLATIRLVGFLAGAPPPTLFTRGGAPPPPPGLAALRLALALSRCDSLLGAGTPRLVQPRVARSRQQRVRRQYAALN